MGGGRFAACAIADLAPARGDRHARRFAAVIGQVAAQRALEQVWATHGPLRGASDIEAALYPLIAPPGIAARGRCAARRARPTPAPRRAAATRSDRKATGREVAHRRIAR